MLEFEIFILFLSVFASSTFLVLWYRPVVLALPKERAYGTKVVLGFLPVFNFAIVIAVLTSVASTDVVGALFYIFMYAVLGLAWIGLCTLLVPSFFDIQIFEDTIHRENKPALIAVCGAFLGTTLIYSGANIGDGDGWWCVIIAGFLGQAVWFMLSDIVARITKISEKITVERDLNAGIRFSCYLVALGLILARASAGDWTSFLATLVEFLDGWVALPLSALYLGIETIYSKRHAKDYEYSESMLSSVFWGGLLIAIAVLSIIFILPPLQIHGLDWGIG